MPLTDPREYPNLDRIIEIRNERDYTFKFEIGDTVRNILHFIGDEALSLNDYSGVQLAKVDRIDLRSTGNVEEPVINNDFIPWFLALQVGDKIVQSSDDFPDLNTLFEVIHPGVMAYGKNGDWLLIPVRAVDASTSPTVRTVGQQDKIYQQPILPFFYFHLELLYEAARPLPASIKVWAEATEIGSQSGKIDTTRADSEAYVDTEVSVREYAIRGNHAGVVRPGSTIIDHGRAWTVKSVQGDGRFRFIRLTAEAEIPQNPLISRPVILRET